MHAVVAAAQNSPVHARYPLRVSDYYLSLARAFTPEDPICRQCLPDVQELSDDQAEDPFCEWGSAAFYPGVKRRFKDRVLVMASTECAVNCRHCTRKNLLHKGEVCTDITGAVEAVRRYPEIREVLISGGDPLMLSDERLLVYVEAFAALEQIDAVRIGTRMPVVLPTRVTPELAGALGRSGKVWVNTQFNHPYEITPQSAAACKLLVEAGIPVSNQTVLLKGVNDSAEVMVELCAGLQRMRVRPYYVFQCDPVKGTAHFRVDDDVARAIARRVRESLGGLAVPRFVVDRPGATCKEEV